MGGNPLKGAFSVRPNTENLEIPFVDITIDDPLADFVQPVPPADAVLSAANSLAESLGLPTGTADHELALDLQERYPGISVGEIDRTVDEYVVNRYLSGLKRYETPFGHSPFGHKLDDSDQHPDLHDTL